MTKEEQNTAIAEFCGQVPCDYWKVFNPFTMIKENCRHSDCYPRKSGPPKYDESLDLIHLAEKKLTYLGVTRYVEELRIIMERVPESPHTNGFELIMVHATAAQRAEAFLKTINKWKD